MLQQRRQTIELLIFAVIGVIAMIPLFEKLLQIWSIHL